MTNDDTRCCGSGTCMINADGLCWCGQRWDGEQMCPPGQQSEPPTTVAPVAPVAEQVQARPGTSDA